MSDDAVINAVIMAGGGRPNQSRPGQLDLWVVLSESVRRVQVAGANVMRAQLRRLTDVAERSAC